MIGSSAIQFEERKQITTPRIRAILKEGSYIYSEGATCVEIGDPSLAWNNYQVGKQNNQLYSFNIATTTRDGISLISLTAIPGTSLNYSEGASFNLNSGISYMSASNIVSSGQTLTLFLTRGNQAYRLFSTDAITWGNTELVTTGLGSSYKFNLLATDQNHLYYMEAIGYTIAAQGFQYVVNALMYDGASWLSTQLLDQPMWTHPKWGRLTGGRYELNDCDSLIFSNGRASNRTYAQIDTFKSDGINVFDYKTMSTVGISTDDSGAYITNVAKGASWYYLKLRENEESFFVKNGTTRSVTNLIDSVMKSKDLENWSNPVLQGISSIGSGPIFSSYSFKTIHGLIADGTSYFEYAIVGFSVFIPFVGSPITHREVHAQNYNLNVSESIMNYSNVNNERITLTIGNYK